MAPKKKSDQSENYSAQRLFIFLTFAMVFVSGINAAGAILWFFGVSLSEFDPVVGIIFILVFLGYIIGLFGILRPQPPLHYAAIIAAGINLVITLIPFILGDSTAFLQAGISFLILYLGIRFPLDFGEGEATFNINK